MKTYFVTLGFGQPFSPGYFEVKAETENEARVIANERLDRRWCGIYFSLDEVHELDRVYRGTLTG